MSHARHIVRSIQKLRPALAKDVGYRAGWEKELTQKGSKFRKDMASHAKGRRAWFRRFSKSN